MNAVFLRESDLRPATSPCWYFETDPKVGCCLAVLDDNGKHLGYLVLEGQSEPDDPLGKVQHGVTIIEERT